MILRIAAFALALSFLPTHAQQPTEPLTTLHLSTQLVLLDATVEDRRTHQLIEHLTPADFLLTEDTTPQPITYVSEDRLPLSISLLFDLTDTVQPILIPLAAGAKAFLDRLRPEDEVAVMTFSNYVQTLQPFTHDHALVEAAITKASTLHDRGIPTYIHESVYQATEQAERSAAPNTRRVQVWLTDGTSNYTSPLLRSVMTHNKVDNPHSKEEAVARITRSGFVASVLLERSFMTDAQVPILPLVGHLNEINHYADLTGGPIVHTSSKEVAQNLAVLIDTLRHRYTLGFKPTIPKPPGTLCHLTLTLSPAFFATHPDITPKAALIRTRKTYYR